MGENPKSFLQQTRALTQRGNTVGVGPYFQLKVTPNGEIYLISEVPLTAEEKQKLLNLILRLKEVGLSISKVIEKESGFASNEKNEYKTEDLKGAIPEINVSLASSHLPLDILILSVGLIDNNLIVSFIKEDKEDRRNEKPYFGMFYLQNPPSSKEDTYHLTLYLSRSARTHSAVVVDWFINDYCHQECKRRVLAGEQTDIYTEIEKLFSSDNINESEVVIPLDHEYLENLSRSRFTITLPTASGPLRFQIRFSYFYCPVHLFSNSADKISICPKLSTL